MQSIGFYLWRFIKGGWFAFFKLLLKLPKYIPYIYIFSVITSGIIESARQNDFSILANVIIARIVLPLEGIANYVADWTMATGFWPKFVIVLGIFGSFFMVFWWLKAFKRLTNYLTGEGSAIPGCWVISAVIFVALQLFGTTYLGLTEYENCIEDWEFEVNAFDNLNTTNQTNLSQIHVPEASVQTACEPFDRLRLTPFKGFIDLGKAISNSSMFGYYESKLTENITETPQNQTKRRGIWVTILDVFLF